jgi:hypothetical protein
MVSQIQTLVIFKILFDGHGCVKSKMKYLVASKNGNSKIIDCIWH